MDKSYLQQYISPQIKRARQLRIPFESISVSPLKNKKYRIVLRDGAVIDYGNPNYDDYLMHRDPERRERFMKRWEHHPRVNDTHSPVYYIVRLNW